jgi:nucleotide-binding universal stress UspA family protein
MKRILVPVDFSPAMDGVLTLAREMARAFQAELHLVHVRELPALPVFPAATVGYPGIGIPEMNMTGGMALVPPALDPAAPPDEKQRNRLETLADDYGRRGMRCSAHERDGNVVDEILKTADELAVNLVIMGSHGHGSIYNLLVGSVTEGILKASRRPVLLVPAPLVAK